MNASAAMATAERENTSIFSFGRPLRPTEVALREHRNEFAKAAAKVAAADAVAANMRATLHAAEATAESARAAVVDRQAEALAAAEAEAAYGDVDVKERKLRVTAERNAFDSQVAVDAARKALSSAEDRLRGAQAGLSEVRSQGTPLVLADLAEQHRELLERLREARQTLGAAEADIAGLAMAVAERGREMYDAGYGTSWLQLAEKMNIAFSEQSHAEASHGNRAHAARAWASKIARLLAGSAE
jgi:pilus assembly protein FimV